MAQGGGNARAIGRGDGRGEMEAIYIHEFVESLDDVKSSTISIPSPPRHSKEPHYLVKITHASPTHVDTLYARGLHQNNNRERGHVHPPFVLGSEFSGIVVNMYSASPQRAGSSSNASSQNTAPTARQKFKKGDKIWGTWLGAFANLIVAPESSLHLLPSNLSLHDAAALGASTVPVSYGALIRVAKLRQGETCLVHAAAGGLGIVAVQIALASGAHVIATVGSEAKARVIEQLIRDSSKSVDGMPKGSGVVIYNQEGWEDRVKTLSGGRGVDVVFDTVGLVEKSIRCCAFGARAIIIGFVGRDGQMERVAMNRVLLKQIQLLGYRFGETSRRTPQETIETWRGVNEMLDQGKIKPVIHKKFVGLKGVPEALKLMTTREVAGKIVVEISSSAEGENSRQGQSIDGQVRGRL